MVRHARDVRAARAARGSARVAPVISTMHLALRSFSRVLNGRTRTATRTFCVFGIARRASAPAAPAPARTPAEAEPLLVGAGYENIRVLVRERSLNPSSRRSAPTATSHENY